jgi:hypothetical protein
VGPAAVQQQHGTAREVNQGQVQGRPGQQTGSSRHEGTSVSAGSVAGTLNRAPRTL